jgi:hypothetical protein
MPIIHFGTLVAPESTPLYARLKEEGRLTPSRYLGTGNFLETNFRPKLMSEAQLEAGSRWLVNQIFAPEAYGRRLELFVELCRPFERGDALPRFGRMEKALARRLAAFGERERRLVGLIEKLAWKRPDLSGHLGYALLAYCQARHMFEIYRVWDPELGRRDAPPLAA